MGNETVILLVVAVVVAVVVTIGLREWWWRDTPSAALRHTVEDLADQVRGFSKQVRELETEATADRAEIARSSSELSSLRNDFRELAAGAARLIDQLMARGDTPVWFIPKRFLQRETQTARTRPLSQLHELIQEAFDEGELEELAFNLGLRWDNLEGNRTGLKIISLILLMNRQGRLAELLATLRELRPFVAWPEL